MEHTDEWIDVSLCEILPNTADVMILRVRSVVSYAAEAWVCRRQAVDKKFKSFTKIHGRLSVFAKVISQLRNGYFTPRGSKVPSSNISFSGSTAVY